MRLKGVMSMANNEVNADSPDGHSASATDVYHLLSDTVGHQSYTTQNALRYMLDAASELVQRGCSVTMWKTVEINVDERGLKTEVYN